jgi:phosphoadenosine phosphosulfate reductase
MLIQSHRHTQADLGLWKEYEAADKTHANSRMLGRNWRRATDAAKEFVADGPCWCGVSWGKDSVLTAHLVLQIDKSIPLRWIRAEPIKSPDCELVRDAFLKMHPSCDYEEEEVWCEHDQFGWHASGTLEAGAERLAKKLGDRTILGIRASESTTRAFRVWRFGENTQRRSAPIGRLTEQDVFAKLYSYRLPVHPAYGMLGGGRWPRQHLRVSSLGGKRGTGHGRAEWESEYYGDCVRRIESIKERGSR